MSSIEPSLIDFSDEAFDAFWDEEARNPNRNRIRIGRQYQAQVAPILKSGESDGRRLEDLETLSWNPHNPLSSTQLRDYFAIAKAIGLFVQAVDTCHEGGLDEDEDDPDEDLQEERPFEILRLDPTTSNSSEQDANSIFSTGNHHHHQNQSNKAGSSSAGSNAAASAAAANELQTKASITTRQQRLQQQQKSSIESADAGGGTSANSSSSSSSLSPLKHTTNTRIQTALKGLPAFIAAHHSPAKEKRCKLTALTSSPSTSAPSSSSSATSSCTSSADAVAGLSQSPINLGTSEQFSVKTLSELLNGDWSEADAKTFARALTVCGKNFSAIKKDYLPWKSVRSIIEFYYLNVDKEREAELQGSGSSRNKRSPNNSKHQQPDRGSSKSPLDESKRKQRSSAARDHQSGSKQESTSNTTTSESATSSSGTAESAVNKADADQKDQPSSGNSGNSNGETTAAGSGQSSADNLSKSCADGPLSLFARALPAWNGALGGSSASALFSMNGNGNINGNHMQKKVTGGTEQLLHQQPPYHHSGQSKRNSTNSGSIPVQEVKPLKARPITSAALQQQLFQDSLAANGGATAAGTDGFQLGNTSSMLGSLNLYLHGELVLKLNAQQQAETGREKWVESMEASQKGTTPNSKRKRHSTTTSVSANGLAPMGSRMGSGLLPSTSSLKRTIDAKVTQLFKDVVEGDDGDGSSSMGMGGVGGGELSGGSDDDDSITSNESSSLVASSPSSSSTIHSAAKKARVKVENLNNCSSTASNGNSCSISPPASSSNSGSSTRTPGKDSSSKHHQQRSTVSPVLNCNIDNELELKKRIIEANLSLLSSSLPMIFGGNAAAAAAAAAASMPAGLGGLFEPPKAHSNPNAPHLQQYSPSQQHSLHQLASTSTASPGKGSERGPISASTLAKNSTSSLKESSLNGAVSGSHQMGSSNGFIPGPVDLTSRKSSSNGGEHLRSPPPLSSSPARTQRNAHQQQQTPSQQSSSSSHSPVPKAAHEASSSLSPGTIGSRLSTSTSTSSASTLFSSHGLFSLPAPPNVTSAAAVSPNIHGLSSGGSGSGSGSSSKAHLKKSSLGLRTGGVQFAK